MKKILPFLAFLIIIVGCKKDVVKTPDRIIERDKMVDILYDLSLLAAIKSQNATYFTNYNINQNQYIFNKYKIDSTQFAQNNIYYAADYMEYKKMFGEVKSRLANKKSYIDLLVKKQDKKDLLLKRAKQKLKVKQTADSIKKVKIALKVKKETDSLKKAKLKLEVKKPKKKKL
jgi:hypothetical protein